MSGVDVSAPILELMEAFLLELSTLFGFRLHHKSLSWVKKRFLLWLYKSFYPLAFILLYYFCNRGWRFVCDLCVKVVIQEKYFYNLFWRKLFLNKDIILPRFSDVYLPDKISMLVCQKRCDSFDTFYGHYSQEIAENPYFLFKRYLEVLFGGFF